MSWLRLLGLLVLAAAAVYGVHWLRRRIDGWIEGQAAANPALRHAGVSVREENADAKRRREEEKTVTDVTDEAILQTVIEKEEAAPGVESDGEREPRDAQDPKKVEGAENTEPSERTEQAEKTRDVASAKASGTSAPHEPPAETPPGPSDRRPHEPRSGRAGGAS